MKKLFQCSICGFIYEGEAAPDFCPKCKQGADKFVEMSAEEAQLVYNSDRTNDIHAEIIELAARLVALCEEGIQINLDPKCVSVFSDDKDIAWTIKQCSKRELAGHMKLGKW
ncbi:MAG: rubredoxin [Eubacteriales bacterium]|nr:rubredoxin [Eubacteriales bacterium]